MGTTPSFLLTAPPHQPHGGSLDLPQSPALLPRHSSELSSLTKPPTHRTSCLNNSTHSMPQPTSPHHTMQFIQITGPMQRDQNSFHCGPGKVQMPVVRNATNLKVTTRLR